MENNVPFFIVPPYFVIFSGEWWLIAYSTCTTAGPIKLLTSTANYALIYCHYHRLLTLIICQSSPKTRCGLPFERSWASMLTMLHPMACDETRARVKFSCFVYTVRFFLLIARSSIVSGQEWLMILLGEKKKSLPLTTFKNVAHTVLHLWKNFSCLWSTLSER
jgi:hypothetical protein